MEEELFVEPVDALNNIEDWMYEHSINDDNLSMDDDMRTIKVIVRKATKLLPEEKYGSYYCPECGELLVPEGTNIYDCDEYCGYCGQRIDWSIVDNNRNAHEGEVFND